MWDAVILTGKQTLLPFELFQNLQRNFDKVCNIEIESRRGMTLLEKVLKDYEDYKKNINRSLLAKTGYDFVLILAAVKWSRVEQ